MRNNDEIMETIEKLTKERNLSISELARRVNIAKSSMSRYFNRTRGFPLNKVDDFAKALGVSSEYILGLEDSQRKLVSIYEKLEQPRKEVVYHTAEEQLEEQNKIISLYGGVAANPTELTYGDPIYDEKITTDVPKGADGAVTIHGDSMEDFLYDGDIAFFKRQPGVENGEIAIVEIDGSGVTCKKVVKEDGKIILRSLNKKYDDRVIEKEKVRIIGKVVK